jgi:hypothetical protein
MFRQVAALALGLLLAGCLWRSPEERMLADFSGIDGASLFAGEAAPEYVRFRDALSERVLGNVTRDGRYRIAPAQQPLYCPGVKANGNHGYLLGVHVDKVMGDSALATLSRACASQPPTCATGENCAFIGVGGPVQYRINYLLLRINNRWKVVKPLGAGVMLSTNHRTGEAVAAGCSALLPCAQGRLRRE